MHLTFGCVDPFALVYDRKKCPMRQSMICSLSAFCVLAGCIDDPVPVQKINDSVRQSSEHVKVQVRQADELVEAEREAYSTLRAMTHDIGRNEDGHVVRLSFFEYEPSDEDMAALSELPFLQELELWGELTDEGMVHLRGLDRLETLTFSGTLVTDIGIAYVSELENLKSLSFYEVKLTDTGLAHLKRMTSLKRLSIHRTKVTDDGLAHLSG
jgi:hypothetical protein